MADLATLSIAIDFNFPGEFCSGDHYCVLHYSRSAHASVTIQ